MSDDGYFYKKNGHIIFVPFDKPSKLNKSQFKRFNSVVFQYGNYKYKSGELNFEVIDDKFIIFFYNNQYDYCIMSIWEFKQIIYD